MRGHRLHPGTPVRLSHLDTTPPKRWRDEAAAEARLAHDLKRLAKLQDALYAEGRRAVLIVLQGMDASGKDGTVKHVMGAFNPSGCQVVPFKVPTEEEAAHDFLWRIHRAVPRHGYITIFNRSHYEDVIWPVVHRTAPRKVVDRRYDHINEFERLLTDSETLILKFYLHISKREQALRLRERLEDPHKNWKFSERDLAERKLWHRYMKAYDRLLSRCGTESAPWHVIPADKKWYRNLAIAAVVADAIAALHPKYPRPKLSPEQLKRIAI